MRFYACVGLIACCGVFATEPEIQETGATISEHFNTPTVGFDLTVNYGYVDVGR
jgi:hypothetical protein